MVSLTEKQARCQFKNPAWMHLFQRTLVIAPHPDDECFVYGLLTKLRDLGCSLQVVVATCKDNFQSHAGRLVRQKERREELQKVAASLGLDSIPIRFPGWDGHLHAMSRDEVVTWIDEVIESMQPTAVLLPTPDHHQDHRVVFEAGIAALRPQPSSSVRLVAAYETTYAASASWPMPTLDAGRLVIELSDSELEEKMEAFTLHSSQTVGRAENHPLHSSSLRKLAALRGLEAGVDYAEVLHLIRLVV